MKNPCRSLVKGCMLFSVFSGDAFLEQAKCYLLHIEEGSWIKWSKLGGNNVEPSRYIYLTAFLPLYLAQYSSIVVLSSVYCSLALFLSHSTFKRMHMWGLTLVIHSFQGCSPSPSSDWQPGEIHRRWGQRVELLSFFFLSLSSKGYVLSIEALLQDSAAQSLYSAVLDVVCRVWHLLLIYLEAETCCRLVKQKLFNHGNSRNRQSPRKPLLSYSKTC